MKNKELIQKLKQKVTSNPKWVIDTMLEISKMLNDSDFENKIIMQASFFNDIQMQENDNIVSVEHLNIQKAKLRKALLFYIDELAEFDEINMKIETNTKPNNMKDENNKNSQELAQKRKESLTKQITDLHKLLSDYETDLILENDPRRKMKIKQEIDDLKEQINKKAEEMATVQKTIEEYEKEYKEMNLSQAQEELKKVNEEIKQKEGEQNKNIKILFLTADPKNINPVRANHQQDAISKHFEIEPNTRTFYNTLGEVAKGFNFLHITSHGSENKLYLEHDQNKGEEAAVATEYLIRQFQRQKEQKELIVLVACESAEMAKNLMESKITTYAIGTTIEISPKAAVDFTTQFYKELRRLPQDIEQAFDDACFELNQDPYIEINPNTLIAYDYSKVFQLYTNL